LSRKKVKAIQQSNLLNNQNRLNLLVLTSSFPNSPEDETCGYIRDFARALSSEFNVRVLAPADRNSIEWPQDSFTLTRSSSWLPRRFDPFQATFDFNDLLSESVRIKFASGVSLAAFFKDAIRLAPRADAICSHWLAPGGAIGALISRITGKPHVAIEHSGALHLLARKRGGRKLMSFIARSSHRVVTVSEDLKTKLTRLCPEAQNKVEVIPMGITSSAFCSTRLSSSAERLPTVLFIGRLSRIKGVDVLIRAMNGIDKAQLVVAGDGDAKADLENLARKLSVNARFLGKVQAAERDGLLSSCDVVVIPSIVLPCGRTEGTPVVCFESMAAGRPVVASQVGGLAEIIRDGENGMLFDAGDHNALRERLKLIIDDASLRQRLSRGGLETAAAFHWSSVGERFGKIIRESLKRNDSTIYDQGFGAGSATY
jgi:glycosyltransferase involved in cell wall biosynthesis